ncbi:FGGY-family carbohydrate kinase [Streptomyces sp. AC495_CC817]|uniref:FGGY-family carbohydrate kinase n=1 Tax=Streptomyces sp. AC495_CC817 TaxID=2823900 RepID=UPI001C270431|nr:FGGY family carbohydrate kinase [Streptomyces sp. AC495_CC817]
MTRYLLGVDVGTFETKGVLVDVDGAVRAEARVRHELSTPRPGHVEHDADAVWWHDLVEVAGALMPHLAEGDELIGVGCSAIGPCVLPVDEELRPLRPGILYGVDTRAAAEIELLEQRLSAPEIARRSGNALTSQSAGPKILWIERNEPEIAARTRWYLTSQSYLVARLTGEVVIDHATAGYFHPCYDLASGRWDTAGIDDLFREHTLPPIAWSSGIAGAVTADAAAETGIPVGTPVIVGTTDAVAEAVGASVRAVGDLMLMYGSSGYAILVTETPTADPVLWSAPFALPGRFVAAAGTSTLGTATRWIADQLGLDEDDGDAALFGRLMQLVRSSPPGANGVLHLPHFSGERTPWHDPDARAAFTGIGLATGRADLARAVVEGVGHSVALALSRLLAAAEGEARVVAIGGATRNEVITGVVGDVTGCTQQIAATLGASYGDAMLAAIAVGARTEEQVAGWVTFEEPVVAASDTAAVRAAHERYQSTYRALRAATAHDEESRR